jgi:hypothetical protein
MKSLPTPLTTKQLDALLAGFPSAAVINRHATVVTVTAPNGTKVLSAVKPSGRAIWHVMAVEGLVTAL